MDRTTIINITSQNFQGIVSDIPVPEMATVFYSGVVDNAFRLMGVAESDLSTYVVDDTKVQDALALADYFTCEGFLRKLATAVDITAYTPAVQKKRSQMYQQMIQLRDDAAYKCGILGYPVVSSKGSNTFTAIRFTLDYLEPDPGGF